MKTQIWEILNKVKLGFSLVFTISLLSILSTVAEGAASGTIDVNVIVNIIDDSNSKYVDDAIKKANDIAKEKGYNINLKVTKKQPSDVVDGNDFLTPDDFEKVVEAGLGELKNASGGKKPVKGLKLYVVNHCNMEDPNETGWARLSVAVVEPNDEPNLMARTILHETFWHCLGKFDDDCNDTNSLAHPEDTSGVNIDPCSLKKIQKNAGIKGKSHTAAPQSLPKEAKAITQGVENNVVAQGGILDDFYDVLCNKPGFNPVNPDFLYADLREIGMFWDEPLNPDSTISLEVQLGGLFPVSSSFDAVVEVEINKDIDPDIEATISMMVSNNTSSAYYYDNDTAQIYPLEMTVRHNYLYDVSSEPVPVNHSLEVEIPADYFFESGSNPFEEIIELMCHLNAEDIRLGTDSMTDGTSAFEFGLSQPFAGPQMQFISTYGSSGGWGRYGVAASGFVPESLVKIIIDGKMVASTIAKADGTIMYMIGPAQILEKGVHECVLSGATTYFSEPNSITYQNAVGYFNYGLCELIEGDLDKDCDVDFNDLAIFASHWLETSIPSLVAWGDNRYGQSNMPSEADYTAIAAGGYHNLALKSDGSLVAWGNNELGQCDHPSGLGYRAISAGLDHSLAIKSDGSLVAWGWNYYGQCNVPAGTNYTAIASGDHHNLALKSDGTPVAWGWNYYGQCNVSLKNIFLSIAAGNGHSLALKSDGSLMAWGNNSVGQCNVPAGNNFKAVAAGANHSLALKLDGSIVAWGWNNYGQCDVPAGTGYKAIAAGQHHSMAIKADGSLVAWGANYYGQCNMPDGKNFIAIAAGQWHSLAMH